MPPCVGRARSSARTTSSSRTFCISKIELKELVRASKTFRFSSSSTRPTSSLKKSFIGGRASAWSGLLLAGDLANLAEEAFGLARFGALGADAAWPRPEVIVVVAHGRRSAQNRRFRAGVPRKTWKMLAFSPLAAPCRSGDGAAQNSVQTRACPADRTHGVPSALILPSRLPPCSASSADG